MLDIDDIAEVVADAVREATAPLIAANIELAKRLAEVESAARIPGERGEAGEKGEPGEVDMEAVKALIDQAVSQIPAAENGKDGRDGEKGDAGEKGDPGEKGDKGEDGAGIADLLIDRDGNLVASFTDGRTKALGHVVGKDGQDGRDGKDGEPGTTFTLDDFDVIPYDDDRTIKLCFTKDGVMHSFELEFPVAIYRGVWTEKEYARGDMVTWGGSMWHADQPTKEKPDMPDSGWRLAVKRGRDGKDFKP